MGVVQNTGSGFKFYSLKSKDQSGKLNPGLYDSMTKERLGSGYNGELLAMRPNTYEYKGETKHTWIFIFDGSEEKDRSDLAKLEINFNGMARSIINSLAKLAEDMKGMLPSADIQISAWANGEYANAAVRANDEKVNWLYEWEKISGISDKPEKWIGMWKKHIKPHLPEEYKVNESAMAGVAEAKNNVGPVEDDDVDPLPF